MENKVLVIDMEESSCQQIRNVLLTRGYSVSVAQTAKIGLMTQESLRCGLVFLDYHMNDLDVRAIVRELKRLNENIAIILMSYPDQQNLVAEALNLNASDYLYKPLRPEEIYFKAKHALEEKKTVSSSSRVMQGVEEKNISLQKQNLLLARRIEESTKNLSKLYEDLRETYMRTIKALAHAIDARDHYTYSHSDNVTHYAELIARQMNVEMTYLEDIKDACQLHDLGKIGVHDNLLGKPTSLTIEEFEEVKQHAVKGAQILEPLKYLDHVIDIVKHHHERWDGAGYPDKLKGENIPLGARIMTVADSYDAMVSARPYRKVGMIQQDAIDEIIKNSGTQFDPKVVESFLKVVSQF